MHRIVVEAAILKGIKVNTLPHDIQNNWYVMHKPVGAMEALVA